jgi:hypothetical protein
MPVCYLTILIEQLPTLRAVEQIDAVQAAIAPHLERQAYRRMMRQLQIQVQPAPKPQPVEFIRQDPQAAAEWFRARGFRVTTSEDAEKVESA